MRRILAAIAVLTLIVSACSTRSDRATPVPPVPLALDDNVGNVGVGACRLTFGPGFGALVIEVVAASPSDGAIRPGDRIIDVDGLPISTSSNLVAAIRSHAIGEQITVRLVRNDIEPVSIDLVLAEHPDLPGVPVLGVVSSTAEELRPVRLVQVDPTLGGRLARVVRFDSRFMVFDPVAVRWSPLLGVSVGGGEAFVVSENEIYQFDATPDGTLVAVGAIGGSLAPIGADGWAVITALTVIDGTILVGAIRDDAGRESGLETAVLGLDAATGALLWTIPIADQSSGSFVPSSAARDPFRDRALIRLTPVGEPNPESHLLVTMFGGEALATSVRGVPDGSLVVGWHDRDQLMWVESPQTLSNLQITDIVSGVSKEASIPEQLTGAETVWPVGDGSHVIVGTGSDLLYARIGSDEVRGITTDCGLATLGDPGWTSLSG